MFALFVFLQIQITEDLVARILKFLDASGQELHHISDPEERLPIPVSGQVVVIGSSKMWVESVTAQCDAVVPTHFVLVRLIFAQSSLADAC